jgi:hypothetical protein
VPGGNLRKFLANSSVSAFLPGSGSVGPRSSGNRAQTPSRTPVYVPTQKPEAPVVLNVGDPDDWYGCNLALHPSIMTPQVLTWQS